MAHYALVSVDHFESNGTPNFIPSRCAICQDILRGILFACSRADCAEKKHPLHTDDRICETCFRSGKHPQEHLVKIYKHCILDESITPKISQDLCKCSTVPRTDPDGDYAALYPIDRDAKHRTNINRFVKCRLFLLPGLVANAKYQVLESSMESRKGKETRRLGDVRNMNNDKPLYGLDAALDEVLDADIALPFRRYANKFPFGNTHISIMIGPLIIENGVPQ